MLLSLQASLARPAARGGRRPWQGAAHAAVPRLRLRAPGPQQPRPRGPAAPKGVVSDTPRPFRGEEDRDLDLPAAGFDSIPDALAAIAAGEFVVVLDDEHRENEGDLIIAADRVTAPSMAFMVEHTSGVVCVGMEGAALDRLRIPLMVSSAENEEALYTAFTVTVDLRHGTSTGISASDRAATLRALADPTSRPEDFKRPGHIFPLRYRQVHGRGGGRGGVGSEAGAGVLTCACWSAEAAGLGTAAQLGRQRAAGTEPLAQSLGGTSRPSSWPALLTPAAPRVCSLCRAACCGGRGTPRPAWTWRGWRGAAQRGCCARS